MENTTEPLDNKENVEPILNAGEGIESPEQVIQDELKLANEKYLRLYAEFDNFRRRTQKERSELIQTAGKDMIKAMLPVMDDFDRALKVLEGKENDPALEGVFLIANKFRNILAEQGLKEMTAMGETFDADIHEGITNIPAPSAELKGKVLDVLEKGYYLNDKVIRYAKVVIGA